MIVIVVGMLASIAAVVVVRLVWDARLERVRLALRRRRPDERVLRTVVL